MLPYFSPHCSRRILAADICRRKKKMVMMRTCCRTILVVAGSTAYPHSIIQLAPSHSRSADPLLSLQPAQITPPDPHRSHQCIEVMEKGRTILLSNCIWTPQLIYCHLHLVTPPLQVQVLYNNTQQLISWQRIPKRLPPCKRQPPCLR